MQNLNMSNPPSHPLTHKGFLSWAGDQVKEQPEVGGEPNTVERQLGEILFDNEWEQMSDQSPDAIKEWVREVLTHGVKGYAEMSRAELLDLVDHVIIETVDANVTTVEDVRYGQFGGD